MQDETEIFYSNNPNSIPTANLFSFCCIAFVCTLCAVF